MDGVRRRLKDSSLPWGLLACLGIVAATEWHLAACDRPPLATNAAMNWQQTGRSASRPRTVSGCEVLCFGDSQVQFAILPRAIEGLTGRPTYNLALHAGPPTASYYQLRHALDAGARPRALVVDFQTHALAMTPEGQARCWSELLDLRETMELARTSRNVDLFSKIALGRVLGSYRMRYEVRAYVRAALRGESPSKTALVWQTPLWRNWNVNKGAHVLPRNPGRTPALGPGDEWLLRGVAERHPIPLQYMKQFLDLAAARRIRVFWLLPPIHPTVMALRVGRGLEDPFSRFVRKVQARYDNLAVIDARHSGYGAGVFSDLAHLDRQGAAVLSAEVAAVLGRYLASDSPAPRWIDLPPYRERPIPFAVEDIDQSRLALGIIP